MKIYQKILNTLKRVLPDKKEIDKELMGIPMKSSKEIWLCPLVPSKVLEEYQERETKRGRERRFWELREW